MAEYIDKNALYKKIAELEEVARNQYLNAPKNSPVCSRFMEQLDERTRFKHMVEDFPPADVAPVKHGKWVWKQGVSEDEYIKICSNCKKECHGYYDEEEDTVYHIESKYCPNCGAHMDLEE